nr:GDSL-type esterase/lipase family protein [Cohnella sp. CFH 77786]
MAVPEASPPPAATGGSLAGKPEILIAALGDSLTVGTGDATGNGYVKTAAEALAKAMDKPVRVVNNLALGGLRADQLLERLDDTGFVNAIRQADVVMLTIGGNDLFQFATNGGSMAQGSDISPAQLESRLPEAENRLRDVLAKIRSLNGTARIVYVGLYNPFYDLERIRVEASDIVQRWNAYAHHLAVADGNATVVATYDLFESDIARFLSSDHFHPNEAGYARIADRIVQVLQ